MGALHAGLNMTAIALYSGSWLLEDGRPRAVSAAGVSLLVLKQAGRVYVLAA